MNNDLISIIVPIYNVEPYIRKCVDGILSQTYTNLEIILVDDGSTDNCPSICDDYANNDNRVIVIHKANGGLSDARNKGLDFMNGAYVAFIDGDDWVNEFYIENLYNLIVATKSSISITSMSSCIKMIDVKKQDVKKDIKIFSNIESCENSLYGILFDVSVASKLFKKDLFNNLRFPVGEIYEDLLIIPQILSNSYRICFSEYYDYFYLKRQNSIMREEFSLKHLFMCVAVLDLYNLIGTKVPVDALEYRLFHSYVSVMQKLILSNNHKKYKIVFNTISREILISLFKVILNRKASRRTILKALFMSIHPSVFLFFFKIYTMVKKQIE